MDLVLADESFIAPGGLFLDEGEQDLLLLFIQVLEPGADGKIQAGRQGGVLLAVEIGDLGAIDLDLEILPDVVTAVDQVTVPPADDRLGNC